MREGGNMKGAAQIMWIFPHHQLPNQENSLCAHTEATSYVPGDLLSVLF